MSHVIITDQVTLINEDPVLNETASLLSQCLRETEDALVRKMLESTASVVNATNGSNGDNPTELAKTDIDLVVRTLVGANARKITRIIDGADKYATAPIRESYFGMMHSDLINDLERVDGFVPAAQYPFKESLVSSEWGNVGNVRFLTSSQGIKTENASGLGNDLYGIPITGEEAYACIDLEDANAQFIYRPLGYGDDPLLQRQSAGFKVGIANRITNDEWVTMLNCTLAS